MKLEIGKIYVTKDGSRIEITGPHTSGNGTLAGRVLSTGGGCPHSSAGCLGTSWEYRDDGGFCGWPVDYSMQIVHEMRQPVPLLVGVAYKTRNMKKVFVTAYGKSGMRWPFSGHRDGEDVRLTWTPDGRYNSEQHIDDPTDIVDFWEETSPQEVKSQERKSALKPTWKKRNDQFPWGGWESVMVCQPLVEDEIPF